MNDSHGYPGYVSVIYPKMLPLHEGAALWVYYHRCLRFRGPSIPGFASYAMAKGAIMSLTRFAAKELGPYGITVNCFLPVIKSDSYEELRLELEIIAADRPGSG